jgi:hypothetical protein
MEHRLVTILKGTLFAFLSGLLVAHKVGPLSPVRAIFTYLIPVAPLIFAWDGFVSCLRTYSPEELQELISDLGDDCYSWEIGQIEGALQLFGHYRITYIIGLPKKEGLSSIGRASAP